MQILQSEPSAEVDADGVGIVFDPAVLGSNEGNDVEKASNFTTVKVI
jgi:hypothetical protein